VIQGVAHDLAARVAGAADALAAVEALDAAWEAAVRGFD